MRKTVSMVATPVLLIGACASGPTAPGDPTSTQTVVTALEQQRVSVSVAGQMPRESFPFFSVAADRLSVNGENVYVFTYPNADTAESQARLVSPSGTPIGNTQISWVSVPNFYRRSSAIVLYVGRTEEIGRALSNVIGPPFAGGS